MSTISSQITSPTIVYSTVYWDADQRKHQSSASQAFVWRIHRGPVNSPHKWPVTRKMFPFDDVIMRNSNLAFHYTSAYVNVCCDLSIGFLYKICTNFQMNFKPVLGVNMAPWRLVCGWLLHITHLCSVVLQTGMHLQCMQWNLRFVYVCTWGMLSYTPYCKWVDRKMSILSTEEKQNLVWNIAAF